MRFGLWKRWSEVLRGDVPLEYKTTYDGLIFPLYLSDPKQRLLFRGQFWDILCDCPYEMHELTGNTFLSKIVNDLKMDHKELLYYLSLHLYSTSSIVWGLLFLTSVKRFKTKLIRLMPLAMMMSFIKPLWISYIVDDSWAFLVFCIGSVVMSLSCGWLFFSAKSNQGEI